MRSCARWGIHQLTTALERGACGFRESSDQEGPTTPAGNVEQHRTHSIDSTEELYWMSPVVSDLSGRVVEPECWCP